MNLLNGKGFIGFFLETSSAGIDVFLEAEPGDERSSKGNPGGRTLINNASGINSSSRFSVG